MRRAILLVSLLTCIVVDAANMRWNFVEITYNSPEESGLETKLQAGSGNWIGFSLFFSATQSGGNVKFSDFNCNVATAITWMLMESGDIAGPSSFGDEKPSLFSSEYSGATGELLVKKDSSFYLSFQVFEFVEDEAILEIVRGDAYYGWVEFHVSDVAEVALLASAIDLGGDSVVVGGGLAPIPEPSAGVLLLLGLSALALRRRE